MIVIQNDFLPEKTFKELQDYCNENEFEILDAGDKQFLSLPTPKDIQSMLWMEGHEIIFSFIRKAHKDFDTDYRIHSDGIIMGKKTAMASVLYVNGGKYVTPNGTRFWEHSEKGYRLPEDTTKEEFDRLLLEDSNDLLKWWATDTITARPNRLLTYDARLFHSKWPNVIEVGERIVLVVFYENID